MRDEAEDERDGMEDPFDDEMDGAMIAAVELVARVKRMQSIEIELPVVDESCMWIVTVKRMGIREDG
jgi:hypothetical protein